VDVLLAGERGKQLLQAEEVSWIIHRLHAPLLLLLVPTCSGERGMYGLPIPKRGRMTATTFTREEVGAVRMIMKMRRVMVMMKRGDEGVRTMSPVRRCLVLPIATLGMYQHPLPTSIGDKR